MAGQMVGLELRSDCIRAAVCRSGSVQKLVSKSLPENTIADGRLTAPEILVRQLKSLRRELHLRGCGCALVLPHQCVISRHISVPPVSAAELELNLPSEFHDYLDADASDYRFDYVVLKSTQTQLELYTAAVPKEVINGYYSVLKRAGFTLKIAVPSEMALQNLVMRAQHIPDDLCMIDIGSEATAVRLFRFGRYSMGKIIETGRHRAALSNGRALTPEQCSLLAAETVKITNFYSYSVPGSRLEEVSFCGQAAANTPLCDAIVHTAGLVPHPVSLFLPSIPLQDPCGPLCAAAAGAALQECR